MLFCLLLLILGILKNKIYSFFSMGPFRKFIERSTAVKRVNNGKNCVSTKVSRTDRRRSKRFNFVINHMSEDIFKRLRRLVGEDVRFICFGQKKCSTGLEFCEGFMYLSIARDLSVVFDMLYEQFGEIGCCATFAEGRIRHHLDRFLHDGSSQVYKNQGVYAFGDYPLTQGQRTDLYPCIHV